MTPRPKARSDLQDINEVAPRVSSQIRRVLDEDHVLHQRIAALIKHRRHLTQTNVQNIDGALRSLIEQASELRTRLSKPVAKPRSAKPASTTNTSTAAAAASLNPAGQTGNVKDMSNEEV